MEIVKPSYFEEKIIGDIKYHQTEVTNCVVYTLAHMFGDTFLKYLRKPEEYVFGGHTNLDVTNFLLSEKQYLDAYLPTNVKSIFWDVKLLSSVGTSTIESLAYHTIKEALWHYGSYDDINLFKLTVASQRTHGRKHSVLLISDAKDDRHKERLFILVDSIHDKIYRLSLYDLIYMYNKIYDVAEIINYGYIDDSKYLSEFRILFKKEQLNHLNIDWELPKYYI